MRMKKTVLIGVAACALLVPVASADAAFKTCAPVRDVPALDGSRYEGSDIYRVRALGTSCRAARRVAVRGTLRGMFLGAFVESYRWRRWQVDRDLSGPVDTYRAAVPGTGRRVRWRFGSLPSQRGVAAEVHDCHVWAYYPNILISSARNLRCRDAAREIRRYNRPIKRRFRTPRGFLCRRVSGGALGGQWRCVREHRAFRFEFGD